MTRFGTAKLIWAAFFVLFQIDALACSCASATLQSRYDWSAHVFTAVIVNTYVEPTDERAPLRSTFRITETFKGKPPFVSLSASNDTCGIDLQADVEYLLFAPDSGEIGLCSGILDSDSGAPQIAALRSFVSGEHADLAEPWRFDSHEFGCSLGTSFDIAAYGVPGYFWISTSKQAAADFPQLDINEFLIQLGGGTLGAADQNPRPLELLLNDTPYTAPWTSGRVIGLPAEVRESAAVELPAQIPLPDGYLLRGNSVEELLRGLTTSDAVLIRYDANGLGPNADIAVRTTNLGDAGARMLECMQSQRIR